MQVSLAPFRHIVRCAPRWRAARPRREPATAKTTIRWSRSTASFSTRTTRSTRHHQADRRSYRDVLPQFVRDRISAFIDNLQEPRIFVNNLLQLRINDAGFTFARFYVNSTLGLAGLFDVASEHGLPRQTGDFGETLDVWGVDSGPYLVLPLFGPSNFSRRVRPGRRSLHDAAGAPLPGAPGSGSRSASYTVSGFDLRSRNIETLDQIKEHALDYYAQFRSIARQYREGQMRAARGLADSPDDLVDPGAPAHDATAGRSRLLHQLVDLQTQAFDQCGRAAGLEDRANSERCVASSLMVPLR